MRLALLFSSILFFLSLSAVGQSAYKVDGKDALTRLKQKELKGDVIISIDSLVLVNYNKHLNYNGQNKGVQGFRIRIYSDTGIGAKENRARVEAKFLSLFPEIRTHPQYEGIYYKLYVGDFRTKRDALLVLEKIKGDFPDGFIVESKIVIEE